jgi:hypothetical protein
MKRVLITGMSGTGKSAVIQELDPGAIRLTTSIRPSGLNDAAPSDGLTPVQGKDWVWRENRVRELLSGSEEGTLFISGCAENMDRLFPLIDCIILLSAPVDTIVERLETRSPGGYGHVAEERRKVVDLISTVEPLLRESADQEIDTRKPVRATVDEDTANKRRSSLVSPA